jgi:hypothetical protein
VKQLESFKAEDEKRSVELTVDEKFWKYVLLRVEIPCICCLVTCRIVVDATTTTVTFGKIGSKGQTQVIWG